MFVVVRALMFDIALFVKRRNDLAQEALGVDRLVLDSNLKAIPPLPQHSDSEGCVPRNVCCLDREHGSRFTGFTGIMSVTKDQMVCTIEKEIFVGYVGGTCDC